VHKQRSATALWCISKPPTRCADVAATAAAAAAASFCFWQVPLSARGWEQAVACGDDIRGLMEAEHGSLHIFHSCCLSFIAAVCRMSVVLLPFFKHTTASCLNVIAAAAAAASFLCWQVPLSAPGWEQAVACGDDIRVLMEAEHDFMAAAAAAPSHCCQVQLSARNAQHTTHHQS
jgi:hypothetical protein